MLVRFKFFFLNHKHRSVFRIHHAVFKTKVDVEKKLG